MRVIGIILVRDEDLFVEWSVRNVIAFCDELIIADHHSRDRTPEILQNLAAEFPDKIRYHQILHPRESHELIRPYANSDCWIFGIDGDEIYDPRGLAKFRAELDRGTFRDTWVLFGNVLNVKVLDLPDRKASGHLAPPCRSMTKLYNFSAIKDWTGNCLERLHGGEIIFHPGFDETKRTDYYKTVPWEQSPFRCLHLCFLKRSSLDQLGRPRLNIMDKYAWNAEKVFHKISHILRGRTPTSWKEEKYARGELVTLDINAFVQDKMS
ncbi:MAG: hypothetical protein ABIP97_11730 [Chthoniobacterales bacterium]